MNMSNIANSISRTFHKTGFKLKQHSPEILAVTGTIGIVASTVMACKATTKLSEVLAESEGNLNAIHNYVEQEGYSEKYTEEDSKKDLAIIYVQTGVKLAKLYAPSIILGALSISSLLGSNHILRKRNAALAAVYTATLNDFRGYRSRVVERFGKELDRELKYDIKVKEIEETVTNEDGTETVVKKMVSVPTQVKDPTSRIWYEGNPGWTKDPEYNLMYLKRQEAWATDKLRRDGILFLNDVYEMLGFPKCKAGAVNGWIYDPKKPIGDNFVDFGLYNAQDPDKARFVNGYECSVVLEFNHDGDIISKGWMKGLDNPGTGNLSDIYSNPWHV